jgi:hypothetical protein
VAHDCASDQSGEEVLLCTFSCHKLNMWLEAVHTARRIGRSFEEWQHEATAPSPSKSPR